jgi:long-chain acyl-CoA synthetase
MNASFWETSYPPGLKWDSEIPLMGARELLADAARDFGDRPAIHFMGRTLAYRELDDLSDRFACGLQKLGVGPGVHVGIFLPNTPHYNVAFFGILKAGGVVVNYSPLDAGPTLEHKIDDSESDVMITLDLAALYPQMAGLFAKTRLRTLVVGTLSEMAAQPAVVDGALRASKQIAEIPQDAPGHVSFAQLLENDGSYRRYAVADPARELAVLQYTGGTTGLPKGAMLTHGNLTGAAHALFATSRDTQPPVLRLGSERFLAVLPPFHVYALVANMLMPLKFGAEVIQHARFDVPDVVREIAEKRITVFCGVPTMFVALLAAAEKMPLDLSSLVLCNSGGAPLPVEVREAFQARTGCALGEGWGMTETAATGTFTSPLGPSKAGSCGVAVPGCSFRFVPLDDPSRSASIGEKGEICIAGPNVMAGYWKNPEATREQMTEDGYLRTGDVGYVDEDGFVYIVDRTKDMLICGGFNVYPRVVEEAIYAHPAVAECAVIGVPDPYRGQSPKAFVALKAGADPFELEALKEFLRDKIGKHEMIAALEIRDALPKTPVGKIQKIELVREEASKESQAV